MDEIELVVKIPKEMVQELKDGCFELKHTLYDLAGVICNGIVLPKGHGRIADVDKMLDEMRATRTYDILFALERVKTIIEADKN